MKKISLLVVIAILLTSCTELSKDKEITAYRAENRVRMQNEILYQSAEFEKLEKTFILFADKEQSAKCKYFVLSKDSISKLSYQDLRKLEVENKHFIKIYTNNLELLNLQFIKESEIMAGNTNSKNKY